ncbi:MAG: hypothetical protein A2043_04235 [Candidatus Schekmanbacteria bacterium GWA2_38_9]|uniref:ABC transporter domain-containing protein n=1 Tax=Candidatus Schekmanbacteria bacterium RIFCSPLOWO2_12_FULL_38_15 TaxID=1817883 RepID=A0A1F7SFK5_9BACT|nr:MAG: hypothetical protein A2043_04235 [Candidatus Schekmanbacteria bacterium GWA2_38_9]OGL48590.1 MAG: hypothetical protein A3H37_05860 [Candidatus Schekmanbacteria bacterium RIFCSPLOWO2_02_FULL_38_14]OGL52570.1 MAG: hypothetical protein A3G31_11420 [Candidatus Schekmanbacteria bacterium RIFCSPLOWO2_12_FULL_38_15]
MNNSLILRAENLSKSFASGNTILAILKGLQIDIRKGEMVAIVGASGIGKSTLLHILGLLENPTSGKVFYEGIDASGLKENELAKFRNEKIGFVFQFHHLLNEFTALENVMIPALIGGCKKTQAKEISDDILKSVGLAERAHHKPGELSGGEQQRVAIARALVMKPKIVLADEPTGNLDQKTGEEVFELLKKLKKEREETFVIVTHNLSLAKQADRILELKDGKLEKVGASR